jgi:hypothetical protein
MAKGKSETEQDKLAALSPFELKDELIKAAGGGAVERAANVSMLNAFRAMASGNWVSLRCANRSARSLICPRGSAVSRAAKG